MQSTRSVLPDFARALATGSAFLAIAPVSAQVSGSSHAMCYEGVMGEGQRERRVIVETVGARATAHVFTRPYRQLDLVADAAGLQPAYRAADGGMRVQIDSARGTASLRSATARDTTVAELRRIDAVHNAPASRGTWTTNVGPGGVIRLVAHVDIGACNMLVGRFDSPDQGQRDLPMTTMRVVGDSLELAASYMELRITLPLEGGDVRTGRMQQNGTDSEVTLRRGAAAVQRRPQEPVRPFPYIEEDVRFASRARNIALSGTLTRPRDGAPHTTVVLVSGSGAQDRDETIAGHRPFLVLADHLTRRGYAVLRFDDRGVGAAHGNILQSGITDIADDVQGAVDYLRTRTDIDTRRIGLLGHSEGGYVAPVVASRDSTIAFVVMLGAPAVKGRDILLAQSTAMARASGESSAILRVDSLMRERLFAVFDTRPKTSDLVHAVDSAFAGWVNSLPVADRPLADSLLGGRTSAQDSAAVKLWTSGWFASFYHYDPAPHLRALRVPMLAVYGALDLQVPPEQSVPALRSYFQGNRRSLLTTHTLPGVNHMMQPAKTGAMDEYAVIEQTIDASVLRVLDAWLMQQLPLLRPQR